MLGWGQDLVAITVSIFVPIYTHIRILGGGLDRRVGGYKERTFGFGGQNQNVVIGPLSKVEQSQVLAFGGLVCDVESSCYYYYYEMD